MRRHHPELEPGAGVLGLVADPLHRAARGLGRVRLDQGRVEPWQVAAQRIELGGQVHRHVPSTVRGPSGAYAALALGLLEDLADADLVLGVAVAEQQADADALDLGVEQRLGRVARVGLAQRQHLGAHHVDPPAHALDQLALDDRLVVEVGREVEPVRVGEPEVGLDAALDPQVVLLAGRDDRADAPPRPREQPVEHRGARVDPRGDRAERLRRRRVPLRERVVGGLHEPDRLVVRRRLRLADDEGARAVDDEGVGHRPAGVDRQHPGVALGHCAASL